MTQKITVKNKSIDALIPYARNARTHSDEQVAQIAASIREFGFLVPVLVDADNGIIAGHGRVLAARKLGLDTVPTIEAAHLSETQKRAFILADNKLTLNAGWDNDLLSVEFADLQSDDFDLSITGFSSAELDEILAACDQLDAMPGLPDGGREPFQQMTFTLHDEQAEQVQAALDAAKHAGPFDSPNENSNGNALARICETYLTAHGHG